MYDARNEFIIGMMWQSMNAVRTVAAELQAIAAAEDTYRALQVPTSSEKDENRCVAVKSLGAEIRGSEGLIVPRGYPES